MTLVMRHIKDKLLNALDLSPVVFLNGPRQAGKSTLAQAVARVDFPAEYVTFDSPIQMAAAAQEPESFLKKRNGALIIDEVQLVPEIFRVLKLVVDEMRGKQDRKLKGQFLLTGPVNIMALPKLSEALVGRMNVLTLYPFSGAEVLARNGDFIERLFNAEFEGDNGRDKFFDVIHAATYPDASGMDAKERTSWFDAYLTTVVQRDIRALADIEKLSAIPNLLRILASRAGGLVNDADIARDAGLNHLTSRKYKTLLKMLFLTHELAPWYRNIGKRLVKSPKTYMTDTLLLCHLLQYELKDLEENRPEIFGRVFENFAVTELLKLMSLQQVKMGMYHFRTSDNKEVDVVLEKPNGQLAAIEIKQRGSISKHDFKGLKELQRITGEDFICGIVLYRGHDVVPFGENLWAVPVSNLWS